MVSLMIGQVLALTLAPLTHLVELHVLSVGQVNVLELSDRALELSWIPKLSWLSPKVPLLVEGLA